MIDATLLTHAIALTEPATRAAAIQALARYLGADDLTCFVRDDEVGVLLPALGFSATMSRDWHALLDRVRASQRAEGLVTTAGGPARAIGFEARDGSAVVLTGGSPDPARVEAFRGLVPLLAVVLRAERQQAAATVQAAIDRRAAEEAGALSGALAGARRELVEQVGEQTNRRREAEEVMAHILEGTAGDTGQEFFMSLVRHLASAERVRYAFVTECRDERRRARMLAFWNGDRPGEPSEYAVAGTPCEAVYEGRLSHIERGVCGLFPLDQDLVTLGAESYLGLPMLDRGGRVIGHLVALDDKPMPEHPHRLAVLKIFASRASAELERYQADRELRAALAQIDELRRRLQDENSYLREEIDRERHLHEMVGGSRALRDVLGQVARVAPLDATVLIAGETGTGKELVARAIHAGSPRRARPLVKVNCGAIPAGLIESELFGHVKGAFTGASDKRVGRFELANGGTLFLDEIGELPLDMQVKLLRALQEREFEPVGSSRTVRVDIRVIAATNRDLAAEVAQGRFRADLYYRLNVFPLTLPPLRARRDDVPELVDCFVKRFARRLGRSPLTVTPETMARLVEYDWPGNVRELENVVERAVVLSGGSVLEIDASVGGPRPEPAGRTAAAVAAPRAVAADAVVSAPRPAGAVAGGADTRDADTRDTGTRDAPGAMNDVEREHIRAVLASTGGVIEGPQGAARVLNLHPSTLRSRMKRLGIR